MAESNGTRGDRKSPAKTAKSDVSVASRTREEFENERAAIDIAHVQNEAGRDAFLALAHTALFAASIAFVGNLTAGSEVRHLWLLMTAWAASVIGLLALTASFQAASWHINRRRQQINQEEVDGPRLANFLNCAALWSFPAALISTFAFSAINMINR